MRSPWSEKQIEAELFHPAAQLFVAGHDNRCTGYITFRVNQPEAELLRLVVAPACRRKGIARRLLQSGLKNLARSGVSACFLEVRLSNIAARYLYERSGFSTIGRRPKYYRNPQEEAVVMQYDMNELPEEE
jgi:ribosomal-protein-alanine N-acetyltransferase